MKTPIRIILTATLATVGLAVFCLAIFAQSPDTKAKAEPITSAQLNQIIDGIYGREKTDRPVGRFQLVPATVTVWGEKSSHPIATIFKIDTCTGATWKYDDFGGSQVKPGWYKVESPREDTQATPWTELLRKTLLDEIESRKNSPPAKPPTGK